MADTQRSLADNLLRLADNTTRQISPQDLRDLLVSALGGYGEVYTTGGTGTQALTSSPTLINQITTNGDSSNVVPDQANNRLTISTAAVYQITANISWTSDSVSDVFTFEIKKNDASMIAGQKVLQRCVAANEPNSITIGGQESLAAADYIQLFASCDASKNLLVKELNFRVKRLS